MENQGIPPRKTAGKMVTTPGQVNRTTGIMHTTPSKEERIAKVIRQNSRQVKSPAVSQKTAEEYQMEATNKSNSTWTRQSPAIPRQQRPTSAQRKAAEEAKIKVTYKSSELTIRQGSAGPRQERTNSAQRRGVEESKKQIESKQSESYMRQSPANPPRQIPKSSQKLSYEEARAKATNTSNEVPIRKSPANPNRESPNPTQTAPSAKPKSNATCAKCTNLNKENANLIEKIEMLKQELAGKAEMADLVANIPPQRYDVRRIAYLKGRLSQQQKLINAQAKALEGSKGLLYELEGAIDNLAALTRSEEQPAQLAQMMSKEVAPLKKQLLTTQKNCRYAVTLTTQYNNSTG